MEAVTTKLKKLKSRIRRNVFFYWAVRAAALSILAFGLYYLGEKIFYFGLEPKQVLVALLLAGGVFAVAFSCLTEITELGSAITADETLGLRCRLSTAVTCAGSEDAMAEAVKDDAKRIADSIDVGKAAPVRYPRESKVTLPCAVALLLLSILIPRWDVFGRAAAAAHDESLKNVITKDIDRLKEKMKTLELKKIAKKHEFKKVEKSVKRIEKLTEKLNRSKLTKKKALRNVSKLERDVEKGKEKLQRMASTSAARLRKLNRSKTFGKNKLTEKLADALKNKNFKKAAKALDEIKKKVQSGKLSDKEMQALKNDLQAMKQSFEGDKEMASAIDQISKNLVKGKNPTAGDSKRAAQQFDKIGKKLQEMAANRDDLKRLKEALDEIRKCKSCVAKAGKKGNKPGEGEGEMAMGGEGKGAGDDKYAGLTGDGAGGGDGDPDELKRLEDERKSAWGDNTGKFRKGETGKQGSGTGGPGKGDGGKPPEAGETDAGFEKTYVKGTKHEGKILSETWIKGVPPKGETRLKYKAALLDAAREAEESLAKEKVPTSEKDRIKAYFESLKKARTKKTGEDD